MIYIALDSIKTI
uniref:Uncharacterized protein n=1 Tax=Lepeophtheirus salmonis TaxID=72036 RepID=A0A0K2UCF5_LEPSM